MLKLQFIVHYHAEFAFHDSRRHNTHHDIMTLINIKLSNF